MVILPSLLMNLMKRWFDLLSRKINFYLLEYALKYILRDKYKNFFIFTIMTLLVTLLASTLLLSNLLKLEYNKFIDTYPDIIVMQQKAGKDVTVNEKIVDDLLNINGVSMAVGRIYGEYKFEKAESIFHLVGIDEFEESQNKFIEGLKKQNSLDKDSMLVSKDVATLLKKNYYENYFNFIKSDGTFKKVFIAKSFPTKDSLQNSQLILMPKETLREIFGFQVEEVSDIALKVTNKEEIAFIATKIESEFINAKVIVQEDIRHFYEHIYNYRSGFFLVIFIISFFTFFIIIYDKMSGLNSTQKKEIGVLKALGWRVEDVLNARLYEGIIISISAYFFGIFLAYIYVFTLKAPLLKEIFLNNYNLIYDYKMEFYIDYNVLAILFFLSVPIYIIATIVPSWRVATLDADEVMR